jgi:hypothetical protein
LVQVAQQEQITQREEMVATQFLTQPVWFKLLLPPAEAAAVSTVTMAELVDLEAAAVLVAPEVQPALAGKEMLAAMDSLLTLHLVVAGVVVHLLLGQ